ncbi:MAG TPA: TGS domain-containing protein [Patescibacteria group bacterium]|nr:TGS domain-containing protein [Patescibacteria group bacterium]
MASTNQSPFYKEAEEKFLNAQTNEEKLKWLEEMIKEAPKHKSSEKMVANLKTRYIKLKEKIEKERAKGKGKGKVGIRKEAMQAVIIGKTRTGKSSLLSLLTKSNPKISEFPFNTKEPVIGIMFSHGTGIQLIENPAVESEFYDKGLSNSADVLILLITDLNQIPEIENVLGKSFGKRIIVFNKTDLLSENEKRKISAKLQSRKYNFVLISAKTGEGIEELKEKLFQSFDKIRIYTKEPGKPKTEKPIILEKNVTVKDVAEKILKGFSKKVKETKIWGPSSKFPGQIVGLSHKLKDMDIVEFKTR